MIFEHNKIFRSNVRPPTFHTSSGLKESPRRALQHDGFSGGTWDPFVPHPWDEDVYFLPTIMNNHKNSSIHVGKHSQAAMDGMGISRSLFFPDLFCFELKIFHENHSPKLHPFQTLWKHNFPMPIITDGRIHGAVFFFVAMIKEMNSQVVASGFISVILATLLPLFFGPKRVVQSTVTPHSRQFAAIVTFVWDGYTLEKTKIDTKNDGLESWKMYLLSNMAVFLVVMLDFRGVSDPLNGYISDQPNDRGSSSVTALKHLAFIFGLF